MRPMQLTTRRLFGILLRAFPELDTGPRGFTGTTEFFMEFCGDEEKIKGLLKELRDIDWEFEKKSRPFVEALKPIYDARNASEVAIIEKLRK